MNRPNVVVTLFNSQAHNLTVPQGEAAYWAKVSMIRLPGVRTRFALETPRLPYLGHIACPDDKLTKLWLTDQHGSR